MDEETYRIINDVGEEIIDPDLSLGYLKLDTILIADLPEISHYEVDFFLFDDGYKYFPVSANDPHVRVIDPSIPLFSYNDLEQNGKEISGILTKKIIDQAATKQYETVYRYIEYTEEELTMRGLPSRMDSVEDNLDYLNLDLSDLIEITAELSGSDVEERVDAITTRIDDAESQIINTQSRVTNTENRITDTELTVEDLLLFIADFAGGGEEEYIEEEEEEPTLEEPSLEEEEEIPE